MSLLMLTLSMWLRSRPSGVPTVKRLFSLPVLRCPVWEEVTLHSPDLRGEGPCFPSLREHCVLWCFGILLRGTFVDSRAFVPFPFARVFLSLWTRGCFLSQFRARCDFPLFGCSDCSSNVVVGKRLSCLLSLSDVQSCFFGFVFFFFPYHIPTVWHYKMLQALCEIMRC